METYRNPRDVAQVVFLSLLLTGLTRAENALYFTVWTGNGDSLMPHIEAIKEQANNVFRKNRLVVDVGTKEHLEKTGALEGSKVILELDTDAFAKAKANMAAEHPGVPPQRYEEFYNALQGEYENLRGMGFYASASDILRFVAFTAYSDQADQLVYHDADVRFGPLPQERETNLGAGADTKLVMITSTKRRGPSAANQLAFVEPSYFYGLELTEYPDYAQFNSDLIFMRKSAARRSALSIGHEQLRTIHASKHSIVEKVVGSEKTKVTLYDAIRTSHPEEARFLVHGSAYRLLTRKNPPVERPEEYTHTQMKRNYVGSLGLYPLDSLLQKEMDAKYKAAGPQSEYVEIGGEMYLRREKAMYLRTLLVRGDTAIMKSFLSDSALSPADVGAVSRQDGRHWFGVTEGAGPDVPVYTLEEEAGLAGSDDEDNEPVLDPLRPSSAELPAGGDGALDAADLSVAALGLGRGRVDPATEPEAFDRSVASCSMRKSRRKREASRCSLYEEENFSTAPDGEFVFREKWPVTFTREDGSLRMIVESGVNAKNVKHRVVADIPKVLVEGLARKRAEMVRAARAQLEEIMSNPDAAEAVSAMGSDAHLSIPGEHARAAKRLGSAYARAVTSGTRSRGIVKAWVLGARAYGLFTNVGALAYGDPVAKTFAALDLSQTVNGFIAHKLSQYAKTEELARVFGTLADNPILNTVGAAANIFFFAQNVRNVAEGHRGPSDLYWLARSSMQMLTLVFEGLNPMMLPMVSVDVLVVLVTQGEYATHVVRSVANELPLSAGDMWKLGASSFFGSRSWSNYFEKVASLERLNSRLANSLVEALRTVNVAVGFPVSTVINEWRGPRGQQCADASTEVWPAITETHIGRLGDLSEADFSTERTVPLKEVYVGNLDTQRLCYRAARQKCIPSSHPSRIRAFLESAARIAGSSPANDECAFYDQSVPDAADPCGNMARFVDDAVERKRLIPATAEKKIGDPLMEPQLRAVAAKALKARMISRPRGWMKEERRCSRLLDVNGGGASLRKPRAPYAGVFKASKCSRLRQCFTRRYIGTDEGAEVLEPYVFRRAGPASRETALYVNAPAAKMPALTHLDGLEHVSMYGKRLVAKADMSAIIAVDDRGIYRGATNATNLFVVSEDARAYVFGGVGTDTVVIRQPEKLSIVSTSGGDAARTTIKGRGVAIAAVSVESIRAPESSGNASLARRTDLRLGSGSHVVLEKGSQFSTLALGSDSTVTIREEHTSLCLSVARETTGVVVSAAEHLDAEEITLVVRPETSLTPQPEYVKRACSATARGLSLHGAVLFEKGSSAVSIDPEGVMLTCSVAADEEEVYRSAYKDLSAEEGERFDSKEWRERLEALVHAGLDEMTVTTRQGDKITASASRRTVVTLSGDTKNVHQSFSRSSAAMDLVVDPDVTRCNLSLYASGSTSTYCCVGSDCFPVGLRDANHCDMIMSGVSTAGFNSTTTTTTTTTTTKVTVTAKGFGIAALKDRESGRYETPEGLALHSTLDSVYNIRVVLSKDVSVVFRDVFSGMERVIPAHYGEVFLQRGYDEEDLLIQGVEMMTP